ncbi:FAD dependent oxidoreductase [Cadophora sp. DSE1049]|nr:FAD dependent oxidoreductase [Cadophora sp. DSE1049]
MEPTYPSADLPVENPTESYWLSQPHGILENFSSGENLPSSTQVVIIGSGISGALIAHEIQSREPEATIVMLEARIVCNGATGRNGGHIKPDCYKSFENRQKKYGTEIAKTLCRFEVENMNDCVKFIRDQGWANDIDLDETRSVDFFMTEDGWKEAKECLKKYDEAGGNLVDIKAFEKVETEQSFRFEHAFGAVTYPACSLWPRKLVLKLLDGTLSRGLQLFAHTPALDISESGDKGSPWLIHTSRGDIRCNRIYHATNGYVSHLLPEFAGKIVPLKGHVAAIQPSPAFESDPMAYTSGIQWGSDFDYMIQRPTDGKPLIYGGQDLAHPRSLIGAVGDSDDSVCNPEIQKALMEFPSKYMREWGTKTTVRYSWTGIMGYTADELPFVGEVPGRPGQFVAAGFSGHGMARVFLTIKALMQLAYNETVDPRVPSPYFDIQKRLDVDDEWWEEILKDAYGPQGDVTTTPKL